VAATEKPFSHFISADAVVSAASCAVDDERCTRQRLERGGDTAVGVEVMRPCHAAAQGQDAVLHREGFVGAKFPHPNHLCKTPFKDRQNAQQDFLSVQPKIGTEKLTPLTMLWNCTYRTTPPFDVP
jgi:hypothetical protein